MNARRDHSETMHAGGIVVIEQPRDSAPRASRLRRWVTLACCAVSCAALAAAPPQRSFGTPEEAAEALVQAVKTHDRTTILAILGASSESWITSGDAVADQAAGERFVSAFEQKHAIESDDGAKAALAIGPDDWPFAFPLVKSSAGWRFDTEAGKTEMLARRIGANELAAINVLLAIVDAQREYASEDRNSDGVREYARRFASSSGKKDGLYWPTSASEPPSPLGPLVVRAAGEGYEKAASAQPYHGYSFRPLLAQGSHASGGPLNYIVRGRMIGGFAAIAYPARYGASGVMTFIVNHEGVVYQRDLGPDTAKLARSMTRFDPGPGWTAVDAK
jgi:hypothetical protein